MHILITGGTGLIGSKLIPRLLLSGHQISVVTRCIPAARRKLGTRVSFWSSLTQQTNLNGIDAVINLAGEPVANRRWDDKQKHQICNSRWQITECLTSLINSSTHPPATFLSGSATGFYGDAGDRILTEQDHGQQEFTHHLCSRWESLALAAESVQTRVCLLRTGAVLTKQGGVLAKIKTPFHFGLGGPLGNGKQFMPWIHADDLLAAIMWLLDNPHLRGPFNMVAPYPVRNEEFAATLGRLMHRPAVIRVPAKVIRLVMGESAVLVLASQHLLPQRLQESGFEFRWNELSQALANILSRERSAVFFG